MAKYVKKYVPMPGHVIINPCVDQKPPTVGLIIPDAQKPEMRRGKVENLWPGAEELNLDIKNGDMVWFSRSRQREMPYMETTMVIVPYNKITFKE